MENDYSDLHGIDLVEFLLKEIEKERQKVSGSPR